MKKRLLIPIILFCLFMVPKNAFAATKADIFLYDSNNNLLGSCINNSQCYINSADELGKVIKIRFETWQTPMVPGAKYKLESTFVTTSLNSYPSQPTASISIGNTNQEVTGQWFGINSSSSSSEGLTRSFGFQGQIQPTVSANSVFFNFSFPSNTTITKVEIKSINVTITGNSTNDAIGSAANSIIQNQNQNFGKLEDKMNENTEAIKELDKTQKEQLEEQKKTNEALTDTDISGATDTANGLFKSEEDSYGLADIIKIPLTYINSLSSGSCQQISVPIPFVDSNVILPCMNEIYQTYFPDILNVWQIISGGLICYGIGVQIVAMVKGFKDPNSDKVEVLDL